MKTDGLKLCRFVKIICLNRLFWLTASVPVYCPPLMVDARFFLISAKLYFNAILVHSRILRRQKMASTEQLKNNLSKKIEKLPEYKLNEVLDFVNFILYKENTYEPTFKEENNEISPNNETIMKFIGGVSYGSLAQDIDKELYGT